MLNILFIIDYFHRTGGTEKHLVQLVQLLPRERFRCTIVVFDLGENQLLDAVRAAGIDVIHLPVAREYVPNAVRRGYQLYQLIRERRIDIVQTYHQKADTYGALIARLAGVRLLITSKRDTGDLRRPWHRWLNRRLRSLFSKTIVVADAVGDAVVASDHLDRARLVKIYNGVDVTTFAPPDAAARTAARSRLGFAEGDFVVGMTAGFRPEKNHDVLFASATELLRSIPTLKILAVGGGPLLEKYQRQIASSELAGRVVFTGAVGGVGDYLKAMDVGCLVPGSNEGFSNAVLEKMASGLPVIVTDIGGNAEAVLDGENGFVIAPGDVAALTGRLLELYSDPARRAAMSRRSRVLAVENFSLAEMGRLHATLYQSLSTG